MDFTDYKARLFAFLRVFIILLTIPDMKEKITKQNLKQYRETMISTLRNIMANPSESDYINNVPVLLTEYLKFSEMKSINNVNLAADLETLTQQADAVKNEIIFLGKLFSNIPKKFLPDKTLTIVLMTDFIRTHGGKKIVYPFDYWEDCVEVYLRKCFYENSNETIAKEYGFKTSTSTTMRAKQKLVADMLTELDHLKEAVLHNNFPPKLLNGTKQPSMII